MDFFFEGVSLCQPEKENGKEELTNMDLTLSRQRILKELIPGACTYNRLYDRFSFFFTSKDGLRNELAALMDKEYLKSQRYEDDQGIR